MEDFFAANGSTIIVGALVFAVIVFALARTIRNYRQGRSACGCGSCNKCGTRAAK